MGNVPLPIREFFPRAAAQSPRRGSIGPGACLAFITHSSRFADGSELSGLGIASLKARHNPDESP